MKGKTPKTSIPIRSRVFVGMSGGVDSSVAAYLLKKKGYDVVGIFMRSYNIDGCAERDAEDARRVAEHIGIPFYVWDFEEEYKKKVVEYMIAGYRKGITPNPDVMCNREIKFGIFLEKALSLGADYVATGHYVRRKESSSAKSVSRSRQFASSYSLLAAVDPNKDQSYFLWALKKGDLKRCLFPIGAYLKPRVRDIARRAGLPTAEKKDSQGICFLGQVSLAEFLAGYIPVKKGSIVTPDGQVVGEHSGAHLVTIGQRHVGSIVRAKNGSGTKPHYVVKKDVKTNIITVVEGPENELLFRKEVRLAEVNIFSAPHSARTLVLARVRYRQPLSPATLVKKGSRYVLVFDLPQRFVADGQSAVWYSAGGRLLGGGVIAGAK